jgi:hypothetical protein
VDKDDMKMLVSSSSSFYVYIGQSFYEYSISGLGFKIKSFRNMLENIQERRVRTKLFQFNAGKTTMYFKICKQEAIIQ